MRSLFICLMNLIQIIATVLSTVDYFWNFSLKIRQFWVGNFSKNKNYSVSNRLRGFF